MRVARERYGRSSDIPEGLRHVLQEIYDRVADHDPHAMHLEAKRNGDKTLVGVYLRFESSSHRSAASMLWEASRILRAHGIPFKKTKSSAGWGLIAPRGRLLIPVFDLKQEQDHDDMDDAADAAASAIFRAGKEGVGDSTIREIAQTYVGGKVSSLERVLEQRGFYLQHGRWYESERAFKQRVKAEAKPFALAMRLKDWRTRTGVRKVLYELTRTVSIDDAGEYIDTRYIVVSTVNHPRETMVFPADEQGATIASGELARSSDASPAKVLWEELRIREVQYLPARPNPLDSRARSHLPRGRQAHPRAEYGHMRLHSMHAMREVAENPLSSKTLWIIGIGSAAAALGLGVYVMSRPKVPPPQPASVTQNTAVRAAVQQIILTVTEQELCAGGNSTVLAFQQAWNAAGGSALTADGNYGPDTAGAAYQVDPSAPTACANFGGTATS